MAARRDARERLARFTVPPLFAPAPLLFLYLRTLVRLSHGTAPRDLLHFLPALAVLGYTAPFYWTAVWPAAEDLP